MNLSWFTNIIVHHPLIILSAVAVFSGTCIIIPFTLKSMIFPKFQDPQMGFSTRGTIISDRSTTWSNIMKALSPSGEFSGNPKELLVILYNNRSLTPHKASKNKKKKQKNNKKGPIFGSVTNQEKNGADVMTEKHRWKLVKNLQPGPNKHFNSRLIDQFCGSPDERYAHLVVTTHDKRDLFTLNNMLVMCRMEHVFTRTRHYKDLCIQNTISQSKKCCKPWSLPNYVAIINDRSSCLAITETDITNTKSVLIKCSPYFHSMELNTDCLKTPPYCGAPIECIRHDAVYNILNFLTSTSFLPPNTTEEKTELIEAMIFLPMACGIGTLPYYHELEKRKLEFDGIKVVAMDFGVKSALFDENLIRDTWLMGTAAIFVFLCMWLYTQSLFLTFITISVISFSLAISYFMYFLVFEIRFFPFMNLLATIVAIGIGADDAFIFCKIWAIQKLAPERSLNKTMAATFQHAFVSMFVTAVTTSVAFLGSYISSVTAVSCFSVFAGTAVIANYCLMITWFPACLVIWERSCFSKADFFRDCAMICFQRWCCFKSQWNLSTTWFQCPNFIRFWRAKEEFLLNIIIKLKYFWFLSLIGVALISGGIVFIYPKLELPNTLEFQLFASSHPFEQYDFYYKNLFWFRRPERGGTDQGAYKLPLRFVWGVLPIDNGDYLDPMNLGTLTLDPSFDMSNPESQEWLNNFCQNLRQQPFYHSTIGPLLPNCFIETFAKSMKRKCYDTIEYRDRTPCCETSTFPFNKTVFDDCIIEEMAEIYGTPADLLNSGIAGPKFSKDQNPTIKVVIVEYDSNYSYSMSYEQMQEFYTTVEAWMEEEMKTAPETMANGFFISELEFYDLQRELSNSTQNAIIISMALALIVLFLSTLNVLTSLYAIITISSSIFVTIAVLVLCGWKLNILESVAVSTAVGLTIDFSLHYVVTYKMCPEEIGVDREATTRYALSHMIGPSLMAALTTGAAGAFMMPSLILPYIQIGSVLVLVMCVSWLYATFLLGSLLAIAGPNKTCGQFQYSTFMCWLKGKRARERPQVQPSNLLEGHELETLTYRKRGRNTPKPLRRSHSSGEAHTPSRHVFTDQSPSAVSAITIIMTDDN